MALPLPLLLALLPLLPLLQLAAALPHSAQELAQLAPEDQATPSCEQLRAMWLFSKRQSRASQISNEIPTYRDPFAYAFGTMKMSQPARTRQGTPGYARSRAGAYINMKPYYPAAYGRLVPSTPYASGRMVQAPSRRPGYNHVGGPQGLEALRYMYQGQRRLEDDKLRQVEEAAAARRKVESEAKFGTLVATAPTSLDLVRAEAHRNYKRDPQAGDLALAPLGEYELSPEQVEDNPW